MKKLLFTIALLLLFPVLSAQDKTIDLSGRWNFQTDPEDAGVREKWYGLLLLEDSINLPGSMPEKLKGDKVTVDTQWTGSLYDSSYYFNPYMARYRVEENLKFPFFLTPDRHYVGVAWYQKEVDIPAGWEGDRVVLLLERPHIETTVWINDKAAGMQNSLCVPHVYDITSLVSAGRTRITVRVDNRIKEIDVGPDSHSITDQTQGNWNGIVGNISLTAGSPVYFEDIQVYPDLAARKAVVKMEVRSSRGGSPEATISLSARSFNTDKVHVVNPVSHRIKLRGGEQRVEMELSLGEDMLTWDEFDPALYRLTAELAIGGRSQVKEVQFGMREFTIRGKWFYVNGRQTMLRGTVENCCFPLTGYAPTNVEEWERVYRICKEYGLNHMRFHSYCPPEAAFIAADLVGIYLQPEGPSWPNHGPKLGLGQPIDKYLLEETIRLTKAYGNYASYCMLACGNEPAGRWVAWVTDFVEYWEKTDPRRVYTGASVGGGWQWQPRNQFHVKAGVRGLEWKDERPGTLSDFRAKLDTVKEPFVSHETGQWCAFPNFEEIRKYTGVNKARNFEMFREILADNGMEGKGQEFMMASGKLQALCYKYEIEKTLRTPGYAGFQLLSLNDYSGQGTALVGMLDVFWDEKGYINAAQMRRFCSPTVPLARIPKFVYKNSECFSASVEVAHFGKLPLENREVWYTIAGEHGKVYAEGVLSKGDIPVGNCYGLGEVKYDLNQLEKPLKLNLEIRIAGTEAVNDWDFWVYPAEVTPKRGSVHVTDRFGEKELEVLAGGGNVLVTAAGEITYGKEVVQYFTPVFWNTSWFKMRPPHTTGIWVNDYHPLFKDFPTSYHSDLQWWELLNKTQVMQFTEFPEDFQPLVQSIDTWFLSRKIGVLFEASVLNGKLMMTTMDLTSDPDNRIVARQLYKSILDYMNSDRFRPEHTISASRVTDLLTKAAPGVNMYTHDSPDELKPKQGDTEI